MAAKADNKIEEVEAVAPAATTVTTATPSNADKTSNPVDNDAEANQPPVRTNRPDVPIAQTLAAGAGAHEGRELETRKGFEGGEVEVDADGLDADGRVRAAAK